MQNLLKKEYRISKKIKFFPYVNEIIQYKFPFIN